MMVLPQVKNTSENGSFLLIRFLWTSKENEDKSIITQLTLQQTIVKPLQNRALCDQEY